MARQELTLELKNMAAETLQCVHTALPGTIISFDPEACTASVNPCGKYKKPDGALIGFPPLSNVPVWFPQGGAAQMAWPVRGGDGCLLVFAEQALDQWRTGVGSGTDLRFDLTNAIAIPGLKAGFNPLAVEAVARGALVLASGGNRFALSMDGIQIDGNVTVNGSLNVGGNSSIGGNLTVGGTITGHM